MAAASANKPGIGGRVYRNTGTYGSPTWTVQSYVHSVRPSMAWGMVEAGNRATRAELFMKARAALTIEVMMKADDADAGYQAFRVAAMSPTAVLDLLILDGLISVEGVSGWRGEFLANLTSAPQEIDGSIYDTFELRPTFTLNAVGPSTVIMAASSVITPIAL
jgi:hypothetical protein